MIKLDVSVCWVEDIQVCVPPFNSFKMLEKGLADEK